MTDTVTGTALEPLRALRYDADRFPLDEVVAPPYDVISPADREALLRRNDHNVVRLELPDTAQTAAQLLHEWRRDGVLVRDAEPALWWHEQRFTGPDGVDRSRAGFFAAVRLSPYEEGRVRPHERTHAHARQGRLDLLRATRTNTSPIFALYDDPDGRPRAALAPAADRPPDMQATRRRRHPAPLLARRGSGGGRGRAGGAGRPRDPDRRRPSPLRDGAGLPGRAARARRRPGRRPALRLRADVPRQPARRGAGHLSHPPCRDGAARRRRRASWPPSPCASCRPARRPPRSSRS